MHHAAHALTKLTQKLRAIDSHLVPTDKAAGELAIQKVRQAAAHRLPTPYDRRPQRLPAAPPSRQLALDEMIQRARHLGGARRLRLLLCHRLHPTVEAESRLAMHDEAKTLTKLTKKLRAIDSHLHPCAKTTRQIAMQQMAEAPTERLARPRQLRPRLLPCKPTTRQCAVEQVTKSRRHWIVASTHRNTPRDEARRYLLTHKPAHTLTKLTQKLRAIDSHLHPCDKPAGELAIQKVRQAAAHRRETCTPRLPMRMPTNPTARHLAVDEVPKRLRHRLRANDARPTAPGCETQSKRPLQHQRTVK